jgi:hypothetical protein
MIAAASFGLRRSGTFANGSIGSGLLGRISEAWPALAPPGGCSGAILKLREHDFIEDFGAIVWHQREYGFSKIRILCRAAKSVRCGQAVHFVACRRLPTEAARRP